MGVEPVEAVDGRKGLPEDASLTAKTQYQMQNRIGITDHMVLNTPEAVANFMSHRRCWQRVVDANWDVALIFEDDACPDASMRQWLESDGRRLLRDTAKHPAVLPCALPR